jgi:sterol desaturase/sphingolipid hydroxylase (fatty acid hydroxylase superfamily)
MALTALHVTISALVAYPVLSLMEYVIHRHFMHKRTLARILRAKYFADTFRNHALVHHAKCYAIFDREKNKCAEIDIRVRPLTLLTVIVLPCTVALAVDPITSIVLAVVAILNGSIWSEIHDEMHRPKGAWFSSLAIYLHLKRRHYLHHRHQNTNFNTLFPMWDLVFRTTAVETDEDRAAMKSSTWRVRPLERK